MRLIHGLRNRLALCCTFGLLASFLHAQVTMHNPQHLEIQEWVQILHNIVCRVVAEEFHIRERNVQGPVTVVLGERQERTVADELNGVYMIYLEHWDEKTFASSDVRLMIQRMAFRNHSEQMAREVIRRAGQLLPANADKLRSTNKHGPLLPPIEADSYKSAIQDLAVNNWLCGQPARTTIDRRQFPMKGACREHQ